MITRRVASLAADVIGWDEDNVTRCSAINCIHSNSMLAGSTTCRLRRVAIEAMPPG